MGYRWQGRLVSDAIAFCLNEIHEIISAHLSDTLDNGLFELLEFTAEPATGVLAPRGSQATARYEVRCCEVKRTRPSATSSSVSVPDKCAARSQKEPQP
jgi:hypothetical protein